MLLTQHDGITASFGAKKAPDFIGEGEVPGFKFRTARAGFRYLPTLNTT
jgi:hypothetical protein